MVNLEITNGAMEKPIEDQDGRNILAGDIVGKVEIENVEDHVFSKVNQGAKKETKSFCTFTNALKDLCHLWNIELTDKMYMSLLYFAVANGYVVGKAWRSDSAMKLTQKRWNQNYPEMQSKYIATDILKDTTNVTDYYKAGHHIGITYNGNELYNSDYQPDCILDGSKFPGGKYPYGHRTSTYFNSTSKKFRIWDSFYGTKYNDYELKQFLQLFKDGTYYRTVYIRLKDSPVLEQIYKDKIKQQIDSYTMVLSILSSQWNFAGSLQEDYHLLAEKIRLEKSKQSLKL